MQRDSPGTLVFCCRRLIQNSNGVTPNGGAKCRCVSCILATMGAIVKLARSQVYHTERPPYLFAARLPWCSASCRFVILRRQGC